MLARDRFVVSMRLHMHKSIIFCTRKGGERQTFAMSVETLRRVVQFREDAQDTPAMAAGGSDQLWSVERIVSLVDEWEAALRETTEAGGIR